MDEIQRRYIPPALQTVHGDKTLATHILRLDRKTLDRKLKRYSVTRGG